MIQELFALDATAQAELVARGEVTARELVDAALERIAALDPQLNAVASLDVEGARARADSAPPGPFGGVPILVKDLMPVPGQRLALGTRVLAHNVARDSFPYLARMLASGLIVLGKSTTSELGLLGSTEARVYGVTHNPYHPTLSATGSSGGSAAAVAAGMLPMAHASDGGGSIRLPAAANGLFGFKPSRGRHVRAAQDDMLGLLCDHVLTRSVRDSARFLHVVEDEGADLSPLGALAGPSTKRLRIGVYTDTLSGEAPSPEVLHVLERTVALCRALGHDVRELSGPSVDAHRLSEAFFTLAGAGVAAACAMLGAAFGRALGDGDLEPFSLALAAHTESLPADAVPAAAAFIGQAAQAAHAQLAEVDVTLCPTSPDRTPELGVLSPERARSVLIARTERFAGYTPIHNMAGVPAMSLPLFTLEDGVPCGSHFAAARGREDVLFALAYELEAAAPWAGRWPAVHAGSLLT